MPSPADPAQAFRALVPAILDRFLRQNSRPRPPPAELGQVGLRLWEIVTERGLPPPLAPGEPGAPGEIAEADGTAWVGRILTGLPPALRDDLAVPVRHLVKACFNPDFRQCRESYREPSPDGSIRRQELPRTRQRTSGAHCVDCPYWTSLRPGQHLQLLTKGWKPGALPELAAHLDVFLPEDFRAFRLLVQELKATAKGAAVRARTSSTDTSG